MSDTCGSFPTCKYHAVAIGDADSHASNRAEFSATHKGVVYGIAMYSNPTLPRMCDLSDDILKSRFFRCSRVQWLQSILVAEDHRDLHSAIRQMLEQLGASVDSAYDGHEAVTKALAAPFDVVLMDLRMPQMNGLLATRTLRSRGCAVPIVALTADPATVRRAEAIDAGCDACFSKPFEIEDVMASVGQSPRWGRSR